MKAEILNLQACMDGGKTKHYWLIKNYNGHVMCVSGQYTRRDNAIRGLRNFLRKTVTATMRGGGLYEIYVANSWIK